MLRNNVKYCECGIKLFSKNKIGKCHPCYMKVYVPWNKGKKAPQISNAKLGNKNPMWTGGKIIKGGYVLIKNLSHPCKDGKGYIKEHRLVMEKYLKRFLRKDELVHHLNGVKNDNRLENLQLISSTEHASLHRKKELAEGKKLFKKICQT